MTAPPVSGIVLAGGAGRRFGGPKLATDVDGRPLLHRAILAVAAVSAEVIVVGPAEGDDLDLPGLPDLPVDAGVPLVVTHDAAPGGGPLAGLAAGLAAAAQPLAIVAGGDQPWLVPALLGELSRLVAPGAGRALEAVALEDGGRLRPLPAALRVAPARGAVAAAQAAGGRSLMAAFDRLRTGVLPPDRWRELDPEGASLRDVDRPEDVPGRG